MDWQAITSIDYWRGLNPQLTISEGADSADRPHWQPDEAFVAGLPRRLLREGYFAMPRLLESADIAPLLQGIETLRDAGWLPVFCYAYDEYWQVFWRVRQVMALVLGEDYRQLPSIWSWYVETFDGASGWRPHRDRGFASLRADNTPTSMTVWVPLTDATPDNGCMHVIPAHLDLAYRGMSSTEPKIQDVRALPTPAGTAWSWTHALLHWGGRSSDYATHPRVSLSFEFQAADVPAWEEPLIDPLTLPAFETRIALICKGLLQYRHMHMERFEEGDIETASRLRDEVLGLTPAG